MIRQLTRTLFRQPRWWALLTIGLCLGYAAVTVTRLSPWVLAPVAGGWLGLAWLLRWGNPTVTRPPQRVWPWSLLPIALLGLYVYLSDSFGIVELGAITFHLQAGMADHGGSDRLLAALVYCLSMLALLASFTWLVRHDHRWRLGERLLALALLGGNPLFYGMTQRGAAIVTDDGAWLNRRYVEPAILEAPERPPNLLILYLESIERTYADRARFGDAYAHLSELGERAHVFEGVRQLDNTGWTMAGMIGSQCGTPLMPAGLLHDSQFEPLGRVVPGVDCLGDLLAGQGYRLTFMGGASTTFAGKGVFYEDHGFTEVLGREELRPLLDDPEYVNNWGLFDDSLYDLTFEKIRQLDASDGPWGLVSLSITGHAPNGYPAQACLDRQGEFDGVDILYSVECSGWLASRLIERLEQEGLLENTLVVVASDHLTMRVSVWDQLIEGDRDNTFMLLGHGIEPARSHRESSIIDIFPTVLEAMGFRINNHRAGLGSSLLSRRSTLLERHTMEELSDRMREETGLQQRLWEGLVPEGATSGDEEAPAQVVETPQDATEEEPAQVQ